MTRRGTILRYLSVTFALLLADTFPATRGADESGAIYVDDPALDSETVEVDTSQPLPSPRTVVEPGSTDDDESGSGKFTESVEYKNETSSGIDIEERTITTTPIVTPKIPTTAASVQDDEDEVIASGSGSGSGDFSTCTPETCLYGGVCDPDAEDVHCICDFNCSNKSKQPVCGSNGKKYKSLCELKRASCLQMRVIGKKPLSYCMKRRKFRKLKLETCKESAASWSQWSSWIQAGDVDIRIRSCKTGRFSSNKSCPGQRVQTRGCKPVESGSCRSFNKANKTLYSYACRGENPLENTDATLLGEDDEGVCRYSLFSIRSLKFVARDWTYAKLRMNGKAKKWCQKTVPFYTPLNICKLLLWRFCHGATQCTSKVERGPTGWHRGDVGCWQHLLFGGTPPWDFPRIDTDYTFLCQHFAANSQFGRLFGATKTHFGTLYDTANRIPVFSVGKMVFVESRGWPETPYMIDRGFLDKNVKLFSSWFQPKQPENQPVRGMVSDSDLDRCRSKKQRHLACFLGKFQALQDDYAFSNYKVGLLLTPELVGHHVEAKISTHTLTNAVPMYAEFYTKWKKAVQAVEKYAVERCGVPEFRRQYDRAPSFSRHARHSMHVVAGAIPSTSPKELMGNKVNIPYLIWLAVCCVRGNHTMSFAIDGLNSNGGDISIGPVVQLEILLSQEYTKMTERAQPYKIQIFPAFNASCSSPTSDDSLNIVM